MQTLQNQQYVIQESGQDFVDSDEDQEIKRRMQVMMERSAKDRDRSLGVSNRRHLREGNTVKMVSVIDSSMTGVASGSLINSRRQMTQNSGKYRP